MQDLTKRKILLRYQNSISPYQFSNSSNYSFITPKATTALIIIKSGGTMVVKETNFLLVVTPNIDTEGQVLVVGIYALVEALSTKNSSIRLSIKIWYKPVICFAKIATVNIYKLINHDMESIDALVRPSYCCTPMLK